MMRTIAVLFLSGLAGIWAAFLWFWSPKFTICPFRLPQWPFPHQNDYNVLGWHVCRRKLARKIFFEARIFSRKMPRKFRAFILWVRKNPAKFPANFPPNFPPKNQIKIHQRASVGSPGEQCWHKKYDKTREKMPKGRMVPFSRLYGLPRPKKEA